MKTTRMGHRSQRKNTFLCKLLQDRAGNTLAIAAAALVPMAALIGGGVDVSRAYMAKTQLQSACDSGVLAGRRALSKTGEYGTTEKAKASKMFNFNFNAGAIDAQDVTFVTGDNDDGEVSGTAKATLPTVIMKMFSMDEVNLEVQCMAELQIGNADIMFVLDNTHSMLCTPEDQKNPCTQLAIANTTTRFYGLKEAVKDFHKTINGAVNDKRTRIRYGFVPYAMTVNVKGLIDSGDFPTSWIASTANYQTRSAVYNKVVYEQQTPTAMNPANLANETYSTKITSANCDKWAVNNYPNAGTNPGISGGPAPATETSTTYAWVSWAKTSGSGNGALGTCVRSRKSLKQITYLTKYEFNGWEYKQVALSTANFKAGTVVKLGTDAPKTTRFTVSTNKYNPIQLGALSGATTLNTDWNGCIEERQTVQDADLTDPPEGLYDLYFDYEPDSDATRWKPMWAETVRDRDTYASHFYYYNSANAKYYSKADYSGNAVTPPATAAEYCPAKMKLFETVELSDNANDIPASLTNYLATLVPAMYTYHDVGMIWGGRLTSPTGLFADNVNLDSDKISVSRHIIFMTDGTMQPEANAYSAYGYEDLDSRIASHANVGKIYDRHMARFVAMCEAIKDQGTTIWVVAFGTTMTDQLKNCSSDGRAYYSSNTTALRNTFKFIAAQVADLRLGA